MRAWVVILLAAVAVSACAPVEQAPTTPVADEGAAARQAVLDRYANPQDPSDHVTPPVMGLTPVQAEQAISEAGMRMRLVPFDRTQPVTAQFPGPGEPASLDGTVEVWLGTPPQPTPTPTPTPTASPSPTLTPTATETPTPPEVTARYVLPPHTPGRLRINPRNLPAVPAGTELTGLASWYGPGFHGLTTACGTRYDMNGPTLATRELRCGTVVRVTGPTGLTVEATVTDWGPAEWAGRRFDLSAAVFNAIAPLGRGVIPVRVVTVNVPE